MTADTFGWDIYMRYTDADGKSVVREERTWNKELFVTSRQDEAAKENARHENQNKHCMATAVQITHEQYLKERK